jgi:FixJ family two-component response regulator
MDRLYEAFFSTKAEGMGIGLNLCRTIVESHQGRMQAENIYNGPEVIGCRFSFWIPVSDATNSIVTPNKFRSVCMSLIPKKGTVYVVDDDEAVRDSLQWLLEGKDYRVRCFDSAESFLSRYDPREVACLIVDIRMGGMTGLELQDRLIERRSPLPIVFITGHGDVPMAVNTMKKGAMDFIQKPFKEEELVGLVERMLDHAKGAFAEYQSAASRDALLSKLTSREAQVLERIVAGRLNKQIADDLGISIKTVEAHRANIMEKLNANTVADLLKIALGQNAPKTCRLPAMPATHPQGLRAFLLIDGNAMTCPTH